MALGNRMRLWFHIYLLLGDKVLGLRWGTKDEDLSFLLASSEDESDDSPTEVLQGWGERGHALPGAAARSEVLPGWAESDIAALLRARGGPPPPDPESASPLEDSSEGETSPTGVPPGWTEGGCKSKKEDRCEWLLCKHMEYRSRLEREKRDSEAKQGAKENVRAMPEKQRRKYLENKFLAKYGTERLLHKTTWYVWAGQTEKCTWADDGLTKFEEWLKKLLPEGHKCVAKVVRKQGHTKHQICREGFTNNFKSALRQACEDPTTLNPNPYLVADRAAHATGLALSGGGALGLVVLLLLVGSNPGIVVILPLLAGLAVLGVLVIIVYLVCRKPGRRKKRHSTLQEKETKKMFSSAS